MGNLLREFVNNLKAAEGSALSQGMRYRFSRTTDFHLTVFFNNPFTDLDDNIFMAYYKLGMPYEELLAFSDFTKDVNFYLDSIDLPNIEHGGEGIIKLGELYGEVNPGVTKTVLKNSMVLPQEGTFTVKFLDTQISIIENFFLAWMYMNAAPIQFVPSSIDAAAIKSFTQTLTATFDVDLIHKLNDTENTYRRYRLTDVKPVNIDTINYTHNTVENAVRAVKFAFSDFFPLNYTKDEVVSETTAESTDEVEA